MPEEHVESAKLLFVMLRHTQNEARLHGLLAEHLAWMRGQEQEGRVLLSGTTEPDTLAPLDGLTVIEAPSREAADALARQDPLIKSGAVTYSMHTWHVNEGRIVLEVKLSDRSASLG